VLVVQIAVGILLAAAIIYVIRTRLRVKREGFYFKDEPLLFRLLGDRQWEIPIKYEWQGRLIIWLIGSCFRAYGWFLIHVLKAPSVRMVRPPLP
jgi:hypothetical protein